MAERFRRPRNGSFAHYCGECRHWAKSDALSGGALVCGICGYSPLPPRKVSMHYALSLSRDQFEGACPLFERGR